MDNYNSYWYFSSLLSNEECKKIIELGNSKKMVSAHTMGEDQKSSDSRVSQKDLTISQLKSKNLTKENTYVRDSDVCWLNEEWLYDLIIPKVLEANKLAGWNYDIDCHEDIQFTKYNSPGGFYGWHRDGSGDWPAIYKRYIPGVSNAEPRKNGATPNGYTTVHEQVGKVRKLSVTINLSDSSDYEGGLLKFDYGEHTDKQYHVCNEITPKGSMIVFPSYTPHCVTPVTKGTRYSLVLWSAGPPFK